MAYKFQVGASQLSGAATQEGAFTAEGLASLDGGIDVNGALTVSTAGAVAGATTISGSGLATSHALASGQGNFTVSTLGVMVAGASTLGSLNNSNGGITNAGAISQATTVSGSGVFSMSAIDNDGVLNNAGALNVDGLSSLDGGIDVNGNLTVSTAGAVAGATTITGSGLATSHALASGQGNFTVSQLGVMVAGATTLDSLNNSGGGITNAGSIAGATTITATNVVSSSNDGRFFALDINSTEAISSARAGDLTSLALNAGGITAAGAIAGVTTITGSGNAQFGGTLDVGHGKFSIDASGQIDICPSASIADLLVSDDFQVVGDSRFDGPAQFVSNVSSSAGLHITNGMGLIVGASGELQIDASNGAITTSGDISGSILDIQAGPGEAVLAGHFFPLGDNLYDLGSPSKRWNQVYADSFIGNIAFDIQTLTDTGPISSTADMIFVKMASAGDIAELPTGSAGKVVRIKQVNATSFQISGAAGTGDTVFDQPADSILVQLEGNGAAVTCVYSGSAGVGKWHII
jgi:hypothetical protein